MSIEALGFDSSVLKDVPREALDRFDIARVVAVHKDRYTLNNGRQDISAELVGKMRFSATSPMELPAVGDWVLAACHDNGALAIIHRLLPRKSLLHRKTPGKRIDFQLIAANIDVALIVQSLDSDFNLRRLERYVAMTRESRIEPVVLLSKRDLVDAEAVAARKAEIHAVMPQLKIEAFSNTEAHGLAHVRTVVFRPHHTYCLLGSSGVGKTTLLNNLIGQPAFATRTVREKDGKGRHATTQRQLIVLEDHALLIDTPGMRELGLFAADAGIEGAFAEINALARQCRFNDCTHVSERGCAVRQAVQSGRVPHARYQNYIKMKKEASYYDMSYSEKRRKDKAFGKMCKNVMKHKKYRR